MLPQSEQHHHHHEDLESLAAPVEESNLITTNTSLLLTVDTVAAEEQQPAPNQEDLSEEDMSSQLNPDALEFVPLSPQSSAPVSPAPHHDKMDQEQQQFIMGQAPQIAAIIEGDRILAQSPRKNNGDNNTIENVVLPDEREFDEEISHRPHEWSGDLLGKKIDLNGSMNGGEEMDEQQSEDAHVELEASIQMDENNEANEEEEDAGTMNSKEERDLDEEKEEMRDELIREIIDNIPADKGEEDEATAAGGSD